MLCDGKLVVMFMLNDSYFLWYFSVFKLVVSVICICGEDNLLCVMLMGMGDDGVIEMV